MDTKTFPPGPYSFGGSEPVVIDGVERAPGVIMRENSGALVILAPEPDPETAASDRFRIGTVELIDHRPKRGEAWKTTAEDDPRQMALARLWMAAPELLEAAEAFVAEMTDANEDALVVAIAKARGA